MRHLAHFLSCFQCSLMVAAAKDKDDGKDNDPAAGVVFKQVAKAVVIHGVSSVL